MRTKRSATNPCFHAEQSVNIGIANSLAHMKILSRWKSVLLASVARVVCGDGGGALSAGAPASVHSIVAKTN